jgi:hypothetical protein
VKFASFALPLALIAGAATASTPASWQASARAGRAACIAASGLKAATASGPIIFSDAILRDAFLVRGTYPQRFMKGARGTMLCLVSRRTHKAETVEAKGWTAPAGAATR